MKKSYAHYGDGWSSERPGNNDELGDWEYSEEDQIDESAWGFWPEHDNWNIGQWSAREVTSQSTQPSQLWICLPAIQDGSVHGMSSVSESDDGEMHAAMSAMNNAARTFPDGLGSVEPRAQCQRISLGRGSCCSSGIREPWHKRAEGCQDWQFQMGQRQEHERKERKNVKGQGQVKRAIMFPHL